MKSRLFPCLAPLLFTAFCLLAPNARAVSFVYEAEIPTTDTVAGAGPYAIAADASGALYVATFNAAESLLLYIADPIGAPTTKQEVHHAAFTTFPEGRGLQGVSVDSAGNVYLTGDAGASLPTIAKKFGPAPAFTEDATFAPDITGGRRWLGNALLNDDLLVVCQTNSFRIIQTSDGLYRAGLYVDNTSNYQRDVAVNPATYDLFAARNGNNTEGSVALWSGGTPENLTFARITNAFLSGFEDSSEYGGAALGIGYYPPKNYLLVNDKNDGQLDIYAISGAGAAAAATLVAELDGSESGTPLGDAADAVMVNSGGVERIFITDYANNRILVYAVEIPARAAEVWTLME